MSDTQQALPHGEDCDCYECFGRALGALAWESRRDASSPLEAAPDRECPRDCQRCSGEYCDTHFTDPCECDVIQRHTPREEAMSAIHAAPAVSGEPASERDELAKWVELAEGKIASLESEASRLSEENERLRKSETFLKSVIDSTMQAIEDDEYEV